MLDSFFPNQRSFAARLRTFFLRGANRIPFCATPFAVARQMLELASVGPEDILYDLGSGDGRIPILAAQEFGCRAVGVENNYKRWHSSSELVKRLGLEERVNILRGSFFEADVRPATVVTLYLLTVTNGVLQFYLAGQLRPGARVVAVDYPVPGWRPEREVPVKSENGIPYTLFLYRRHTPFSRARTSNDSSSVNAAAPQP